MTASFGKLTHKTEQVDEVAMRLHRLQLVEGARKQEELAAKMTKVTYTANVARAVGDHVTPEKWDKNPGADLKSSTLSKGDSEQIPRGGWWRAQWTVSGPCLRDLMERGRQSPLLR